MFLAPDGSEIEIADTAAKFLSRAIPLDRLHGTGASPALGAELRADFAAMGWFGLVLPEADGGSGLSAVEHALFYREVGRHCGPVDILVQGLAAMVSDDGRLRGALLAGEQCVLRQRLRRQHSRLLGSHDAAPPLYVERDGARLLDVSAIRDGRASEPRSRDRDAHDRRGTPRTVAVSSDGDVWSLGQPVSRHAGGCRGERPPDRGVREGAGNVRAQDRHLPGRPTRVPTWRCAGRPHGASF
jgi:hypothetical protein